MSKGKSIALMLFGVLWIAIGVGMFVHDADYILFGNTVDLNQILETGGTLPRDRYVTYECREPIVNYAQTKRYAAFIPLPGKTEQFAFLAENDMIMSAEISKKATIREMAEQIEHFYADVPMVPVTLVGCFEVNKAGMDRYLEACFEDVDLEGSGLILTSYCINTTKTRLKNTLLYLAALGLGILMVVVGLKNLRRA